MKNNTNSETPKSAPWRYAFSEQGSLQTGIHPELALFSTNQRLGRWPPGGGDKCLFKSYLKSSRYSRRSFWFDSGFYSPVGQIFKHPSGRRVMWCACFSTFRQHMLHSHSRSVFSTLTCATGQRIMSSERVLCERTQLNSSVPGEPS